MIRYIFENRVVSEKANAFQIFKVIDALIENGHGVELIYGNERKIISKMIKNY